MQDVQNIPNPDVNSPEANEEFSNHPRPERDPRNIEDLPEDIEGEPIPIPPGENAPLPVEDPNKKDRIPIDEVDENAPKKIVDN